jgi:hypothetical protein
MAVKAGADTIEHGYYLTEEELHLMAEYGTIWLPTLSPRGTSLRAMRCGTVLRSPRLPESTNLKKKMFKKPIGLG